MQGPDSTEVTRHPGSLRQANHYTFALRQTYASISSQFYEVPKARYPRRYGLWVYRITIERTMPS